MNILCLQHIIDSVWVDGFSFFLSFFPRAHEEKESPGTAIYYHHSRSIGDLDTEPFSTVICCWMVILVPFTNREWSTAFCFLYLQWYKRNYLAYENKFVSLYYYFFCCFWGTWNGPEGSNARIGGCWRFFCQHYYKRISPSSWISVILKYPW